MTILDTIVEAVYVPPHPDAAPPWAHELIGRRSLWLAYFRIEDGPGAGQWAMTRYPLLPVLEGPVRSWVPQSHLCDVRITGRSCDAEL